MERRLPAAWAAAPRLPEGTGGALGPAATGQAPESVCTRPARAEAMGPDPALAEAYEARLSRHRALCRALSSLETAP